MLWLQLISYLSWLTFVTLFIVKVVKYSTMPIHLRWELYPVPHEKGHKYGGSYLEELDWWTKPQQRNLLRQVRYMVREGLLFQKCYRNNRGLWYFTYPFHIGLFLLILWLILLLIGALSLPVSVPDTGGAGLWLRIIHYMTLAVGLIGLVLGTFGCIGLLIKRSVDRNLRLYTAPADYFNLSFILAILLSVLAGWYFFDPAFAAAREFTKSLFTYSLTADINPAMVVSIILFSLFLIYVPFTHMMHGLAKYFTYHRVFWEDEPNLRGSSIEKVVEELLSQPVSWTAPHIQCGKRWNEVAPGKTAPK